MSISDAIKDMSQAERSTLLAELLRFHVGVHTVGDAENNWCAIFQSDGLIAPRDTKTLTTFPQMDFKPRQLIICEGVSEIREEEDFYADRTVGPWWKRRKERVLERRITHKRNVVHSRNNWIIRGMFVGQKSQFPSYNGILGDAFGPSGTLTFRDVCLSALSISLIVENASNRSAEFFGLLLGSGDV